VSGDLGTINQPNQLGTTIPDRLISSWTPRGVQGTSVLMSKQNRPTLTILNPSTSLDGATALQIALSVM
jgi:hypothetical protein